MAEIDEMKTYRDSRGWLYRVMSGLGEDNYKARYNKPGCKGWKCVANLPWRNTWNEAEQDLAEYAQRKKMDIVK